MSEFKALQAEKKEQRVARGGRCRMCNQILELPKKKLVDFYDAMVDDDIGNETIVRVVGNWGVTTSITTIADHRKGRKGLAPHMATIKKAAGL